MAGVGGGAWPLEAFGDPRRPRGHCNVTLDVYPSTEKDFLTGLCGHLRLLSGFETLVVRVVVNRLERDPRSKRPYIPLMGEEAEKAWLGQRETSAVPWSVFMCRFVYNLDDLVSLKWYLGEGVLKGQDESSFRLVFHPWRAQEGLGVVSYR